MLVASSRVRLSETINILLKKTIYGEPDSRGKMRSNINSSANN
jgi:hypothetical protein